MPKGTWKRLAVLDAYLGDLPGDILRKFRGLGDPPTLRY
jgi:hypothetical protein